MVAEKNAFSSLNREQLEPPAKFSRAKTSAKSMGLLTPKKYGGPKFGWRREWDSNPRYGFPHTRFPSVRLKPLGHLSGGPSHDGARRILQGRAGLRSKISPIL